MGFRKQALQVVGWGVGGCLALFSLIGCADGKNNPAPTPMVLWSAEKLTAPPLTISEETPARADGMPLSLEAAIDLALNNNPSTRVAWREAKAAAAGRSAAYNDFYPHLSGSVSFERSKTEFGGTPFSNQRTVTSPALALSYTILDFGTRSSTVKVAEAALRIANLQYNRALQETIFEVQRRYFLLHATKATVEAKEETIKETQRSYQAAQKSFSIGSKPKQDVLQAEASLRRSEFELEDAKASVEEARAAFTEVLGAKDAGGVDVLPPDFSKIENKVEGSSITATVEEALRSRPDLQAAYEEVNRALSQSDAVRQGALPKIVGTMNGNRNYLYGGGSVEENYSVGVELQVPIFTGFQNYYSIEQERQRAAAALERSRTKELAVEREVWSTFYRFTAAVRQTGAARALVAAAEESFKAVEQGYSNGSNSVLDLLAAQRELSNARMSLISARADAAISYAKLELSVGALSPRS